MLDAYILLPALTVGSDDEIPLDANALASLDERLLKSDA